MDNLNIKSCLLVAYVVLGVTPELLYLVSFCWLLRNIINPEGELLANAQRVFNGTKKTENWKVAEEVVYFAKAKQQIVELFTRLKLLTS